MLHDGQAAVDDRDHLEPDRCSRGAGQRIGALEVVGDTVVSTPVLGVLLICFVAAITSLFAASPGVLGVVIPLSIPLLSTGAVSVTAVVIAVAISATVVDASPFSAVGALVLANSPETRSRADVPLVVLVGLGDGAFCPTRDVVALHPQRLTATL